MNGTENEESNVYLRQRGQTKNLNTKMREQGSIKKKTNYQANCLQKPKKLNFKGK